jgi:hypothetical protein
VVQKFMTVTLTFHAMIYLFVQRVVYEKVYELQLKYEIRKAESDSGTLNKVTGYVLDDRG